MWRWAPQAPSNQALMLDSLKKLCGNGEFFQFTLSGAREAKNSKIYFIHFPDDAVVVANNNPLQIGSDGEYLFFKRFHLLKNTLEVHFEGMLFRFGENVVIRLGTMKRLQSADLCEFCDIRWAASGVPDTSGMASELLNKLFSIQNESQGIERKPVVTSFHRIPSIVPFGARHLALLMVKMYEDVSGERDSL